MQEKVCKGWIKNVDELRSRILTDELDQSVPDTVVTRQAVAHASKCVWKEEKQTF